MTAQQHVPFPFNADPTAREIINVYLDLEGPELHPDTLKLSKRYLGHFARSFGDRRCSSLRRSELKVWLKSQTRWAIGTQRSCLSRIKACFGWALRDDRIDRHPYSGMSWQQSKRKRSMTDAEYVTIMRNAGRLYRRMVYFLKQTGCRPGEAANLEWSMIDWEKRTAVLQVHKTAAKTGQPRTIYLTKRLCRVLRSLERQRLPGTEHVFLNNRGLPWKKSSLDDQMAKIRERAGLAHDCVLYLLRHRSVTVGLSRTHDVAAVSKLHGHASIKTTMGYVHIEEEERPYLLDSAEKATGRR